MRRRLIVSPKAEADIIEAALWYDQREAGLGWDFTSEIGIAIGRAVQNPFHHLQLRKSPDLRSVLAARFPYRIFFIVRAEEIVILAILHAARHDSHWQRRIV